jgi:acetyl esterase/lipase
MFCVVRTLVIKILLCAGAAAVHAQTCDEYPLRPLTAPAAPPAEERVLFYQRGLDDHGLHRLVVNVAVPTLTIYRPAPEKNLRTAFVVCPGGAYHNVVIDREGRWIARHFQDRGFTVAVLKYRLPKPVEDGDKLPRPQQDALDAIRWLRARAKEWDVDARRVGIMGFSTGGHLAGTAALLGRAADGSRPDFVAMLYPVVSMTPPLAHAGSRDNLLGAAPSAARLEQFSLEKQARPGLPPFFIVHAKDDEKTPSEASRRLAAALHQAGVPAELVLYDKGGHGFALGRGAPSDEWKDAFTAWLSRILN